MKFIASILSASLLLPVVGYSAACTANEVADLKTAESAVLKGLPIACTIADILDPALMTTVCVVLDAAGAAIASTATTTVAPTAAAAASLVTAHPAPVAIAPAIKMMAKTSKR